MDHPYESIVLHFRFDLSDIIIPAEKLSVDQKLQGMSDMRKKIVILNGNPCRESALLMAAEGYGFEETICWYDRTMNHIHWTDKGKVLCGSVMNPGDIEGGIKLEEAYQLGRNI